MEGQKTRLLFLQQEGAGQTPPIPILIPPETPGFNLAVSPVGGGSCSLPAPSRPTNPLRRLEQEGAGQTPRIPLLMPPETPGFNLAVSPAGGGSCSLPAPSRPTSPLRWLGPEGCSNAALSPSNPTRDARVQSGCFTGGRRELFSSSPIPTHQSAALAGAGGLLKRCQLPF